MISLAVKGTEATAHVDEPITTGSVGLPVSVTLSEGFDDLTAIVVFKAGSVERDIAYAGKRITVPAECLAQSGIPLEIGVYGANEAGDRVTPTIWAPVGTIRQGVRPSGVDPAEPTPSWPAQVQKIAADALAAAEAAQAEVDAWEEAAGTWTAGTRVTSLDATELSVAGSTVEAMGAPAYVADVATLADYGITETGWYVLARIAAPSGVTVTEATTVAGADGSIVTVGADHVDVAVRFDVAALAKAVAVAWDEGHLDAFAFRATDLAVRNLDYRTTFNIYDLEHYATWEFEPATDAEFTSDHFYYTLAEDGTYELASVTIGDPVPADTYYKHSKVTLEGMPRNITYRLNTVVDCPMIIILPDVADDGYGCWYEFSVRRNGSYSIELVPPNDDVKIATNGVTAFSAGIDVTDLHYSNVGGVEAWRATNTHSNFTVPDPRVTGLTIRKPPTKVEYAVGEALDVTGIEVLLDFADGNSRLLTNTDFTDEKMTFSPAIGEAVAAGTTELAITYEVVTGTFTANTPITVTGGE